MGAGSKRITSKETQKFIQENTISQSNISQCLCHIGLYRNMVRKIGICKFFNTRKPYMIEQCEKCKSEYVVEL